MPIQLALALLTVLFVLPVTAFATAQEPDILIYKGNTYELFANPLEHFYERRRGRPSFLIEPLAIRSSNWRGYVATWTIEDGLLYLVKLDSWLCRAWKKSTCKMVDLQRLFGNRYRDGKVRADWFSGELKMPDGKLLQWVHMGYGSVYEREITLHVESGKVVSASTFDNTQRTLPPGRELERRQLEKLKPKPPLKR